MATKSDITKAATDSDRWLKAKQKAHIKAVQNSTKKLQKDILNQMRLLKTADDGSLLGMKTNLGQAQKLQKKIEELFYSDFNNHTKKIVRDFKTAAGQIKLNFKTMGEAAKFTSVDDTMMTVLRDGYYADYLGISEDAKQKVTQAMYDSVLAGGKISDLESQIRQSLMGSAAKSVVGTSLAQYARLYARDQIMNYHGEVMLKKAEDLKMDTMIYTGTLMASSRRFCRRRVGNPYTIETINSWKYKWQGKSGPALTHRGGYNCRHHWQPVRKRWLDDKELTMMNKLWKLDKKGMPIKGLSSTAKARAAKRAAEIRKALKEGVPIPPAAPTPKPIVDPKPVSSPTPPKLGAPIDWKVGGRTFSRNKLDQKWGKGVPKSFDDAVLRNIDNDKAFDDLMFGLEQKGESFTAPLTLKNLKTKRTFVDTKSVNKMVDDWDPILYKKGGIPTVYELPDGTLLLRDGDLRINAALIRGTKELEVNIIKWQPKTAVKPIPKPKPVPKPKAPVPDIKPFDPDLDMKWRKAETFPGLKTELKSKYNVGDVIEPTKGTTKLSMKKLNLMGKSIGDEIFDQLPELKEMAHSRLFHARLKKIEFDIKGRRKDVLASYWKDSKRMTMYKSSTLRTTDDLVINSVSGSAHNVGLDLKTTFRHEYGHHVHLNLLSPEKRKIWNDWHRTKSSAYFKENLSHYAGTNYKEAFAEAFSAYTSPLYGTRGKVHGHILRMDREMEGILEKVIGRKKTLLAYDREKIAKKAAEARAREVARKALAKKEAVAKAEALKRKKAAALLRKEEDKLARLGEAARAKKLAEEGKDLKAAGPVKLNKRQKDSIKLSNINELNDSDLLYFKELFKEREMDVSFAQIKKFAKNFDNQVPFYMNREMRPDSASYRDIMANGKFKNQFQLGRDATSSGSHGPYKGSGRDTWEKNISQGILQSNPKYKKLGSNDYMNVGGIGAERPIYGYTSDPASGAGAYLGGRYGEVVFKLKQKNMRKRSTLFTNNTSAFERGSDTMSSSKNNKILLQRMIENKSISNADFKKIMQGKIAPKGFTTGYSYTESQMYGGIDLKRDVEMISIPSRRGNQHVIDLANKWGIKYEVRD